MGEDVREAIPYERFQEVVAQKNEFAQLKNTLAAELKALQEKAAAWETERTGLVKEIEAREATLKEKETSAAQAHLTAQQLRAAAANGLPLELADRLHGADEAALVEDAKRIAAFLKPSSPGVPPPPGGTPPPALDLSKMTPAEIRKARAEGKLNSAKQ